MRTPRTIPAMLLAATAVAPPVAAQNTAALPAVCETLPGNAAIALPLRWSEGRLQVLVDPPMLPANFVGETITGVRLRRSVLPGAEAYPALTRTLTVLGGFHSVTSGQINGDYMSNRPPNHLTLFGPAPVTIPATPAPGDGTTVGDEFVQITFTTPLPVVAGTLFLEFEAGDGPLQIEQGSWVDAVWFEGGVDHGLAVVVGDGSCTTENEPTELRSTDGEGPLAGAGFSFEVTGVPDGSLVLCWIGLDPEGRGPDASYLGYGVDLGVFDPLMSNCRQWAPFDVSWTGTADAIGELQTSVDLPGAATVGTRFGLQAAWLDPSRPTLPLSFSNGLQLSCNSAGVQNHCTSFFFPPGVNVSPWGVQTGLMPVLLLDH